MSCNSLNEEFKIIIRNLRARTIIGVHPHERSGPRQVIVNIEIWASLKDSVIKDSIEYTVDYGLIKDEVLSYISSASFSLLESLAYGIAKVCLQDHRVRAVRVLVEKPGALEEADSVGVEVYVARPREGAQAFITVWSSGSSVETVRSVAAKLKGIFGDIRISTVYEIESEQSMYLAYTVSVNTTLSPLGIRKTLDGVMSELGGRNVHLELLLYGNLVMKTPELSIPSPRILSEPALIAQLYELEPDLVIPGVNKAIRGLIKDLKLTGRKPLVEFTNELRRVIES